jgi:two-component system OmpR family sensor kinase
MVFHSIRWRILAWNFGLLATTATVLLVAFYQHERQNRLQAVDLQLREMMSTHMGAVNDLALGGNAGRTPPPNPNGRPRNQDNPQQRQAKAEVALASLAKEKTWVFVVDMSGPVQFQTATAPVEPALVERCREEVLEETDGTTKARQPINLMVSHLGHRMLVHRPPGQMLVVFGTDTHALEAELHLLGWKLTLGGIILVVLGGGIGWILAGRSLRPIDRIAADAEGIAAGDYGRKIDAEDTESELGRLAVVLNDTFGKMNEARDRVTQFTADASHELRTPLTVILSDSQGALRQERTPEEYRQALVTIKQAALRMKTISDGLLELAHGDLAQPVEKSPCDFADLADEAVALLARLAREKGATLEAKLEGVSVLADPARLGRVILNLVMNAILHNPAGVRVVVTTGVVAGQAELSVADDGRGIPAENLEHIFERFRRIDPEGSRHTEGAGLGLAIVKQAVEAHGGTIAVTSEVGRGTTFRVRLPVAA